MQGQEHNNSSNENSDVNNQNNENQNHENTNKGGLNQQRKTNAVTQQGQLPILTFPAPAIQTSQELSAPVIQTSTESPAGSSSDSSNTPAFEQPIEVVGRGDEIAPNGYSFPVYSKIDPLDFSAEGRLCAGVSEQATRKDTVLVYLCGTDLESGGASSASYDIYQMLESKFDMSKVNVLILAGGTKEWQNTYMAANGNAGKCVVYQLISSVPAHNSGIDMQSLPKIDRATALANGFTLDSDLKEATLKKLVVLGEQNMGNPAILAGFMDFAYKYYPSERHEIILWNHGGGINSGICFDETVVNEKGESDGLTIPELGSAFRSCALNQNGEKWDMIGMDACLMSTIEVAASLASYGNYMIASQEVEMGGWNYKFLKGMEECTTEETGRIIVEDYLEGHNSAALIQTLALIDLNQILFLCDDYEEVAKDLLAYQAAHPTEFKAAAAKARAWVTEYGVSETSANSYCLVDLQEFLGLLGGQNIVPPHADDFLQQLSDAILVAGNTKETAGLWAKGLSVYFSYDDLAIENYKKLSIFPNYTKLLSLFVESNTPGEAADIADMVESFTYTESAEAGGKDYFEVVIKEEEEYWEQFFKNFSTLKFDLVGYGICGTNKEDTEAPISNSLISKTMEPKLIYLNKNSRTYRFEFPKKVKDETMFLLNGYAVEPDEQDEYYKVDVMLDREGAENYSSAVLYFNKSSEGNTYRLDKIEEAGKVTTRGDDDWEGYMNGRSVGYCISGKYLNEDNWKSTIEPVWSCFYVLSESEAAPFGLLKVSVDETKTCQHAVLELSDKKGTQYYYKIADDSLKGTSLKSTSLAGIGEIAVEGSPWGNTEQAYQDYKDSFLPSWPLAQNEETNSLSMLMFMYPPLSGNSISSNGVSDNSVSSNNISDNSSNNNSSSNSVSDNNLSAGTGTEGVNSAIIDNTEAQQNIPDVTVSENMVGAGK